jgi:hypothetical protein
MRRLLPILLIFILGSLAPASAQDWVEFKPPGAGYRVEFPQAPKVQVQDVTTTAGMRHMGMATFESQRDGVLLSFMTTFPERPNVYTGGDPQVLLDRLRSNAVSAVNGRLREEKRITVDGQPARLSVIDMPKDQVAVVLHVMRGDQLYQAVAVVSAGQENGADTQHFINSFALLPL